MDFLLGIVKPDLSVFTKLDTIHIENFLSKNDIWEEKFKLILNTKIKTYLNYDDSFLRENYNNIKIKKEYFNKIKLKSEYINYWNDIFSKLGLSFCANSKGDIVSPPTLITPTSFISFKITLDASSI